MFIIMGYVYYYGVKLVDAASVSLKDLHFLYRVTYMGSYMRDCAHGGSS